MPSEANAIRRAAASQLRPCCWWYWGTFRIRQLVAWVVNVRAASAAIGLAMTNTAAAAAAATTTRRPREDSRRYGVRCFPPDVKRDAAGCPAMLRCRIGARTEELDYGRR